MGEYTKQLRKKLAENRARRRLEIKSRVAPFKVAAGIFKGRKIGEAGKSLGLKVPSNKKNLTGLHGAIQADPRYAPALKSRTGKKPLSPKQRAALRKAQAAAARANRKRK